MTEGKIFIGTSGWNYGMWVGILYPEHLSSKEYLNFYSEHFNTVEINSSFYHFPKNSTYKNWYSMVPEQFLFSVKIHRSITHIKKFADVEEELERFFEGVRNLKKKLGVILFQFPASFRCNDKNLKKIEIFFRNFKTLMENRRVAFEFRHISWDNEKICKILAEHKAGWVIANSSRYPEIEKITSDFVYLRMHGPKELFASEYSEAQIRKLAEKIKKWKKTKDIFVYFNNDVYGYAVKNARQLKKILNKNKSS